MGWMKWFPLAAILLALGTVPAISVSPDSGEPGTEFVVTGSGFEPGERVKVLWDGANLGGTTKTDADGAFSYSGTVPDAAAPGAHTIAAEAVGGGASKTRVSFTVTSGSTSTSSTVTSTTTTPTTTPSTTAATSPSTTLAGSAAPTAQPQKAETTPSDDAESTDAGSPDDSESAPTGRAPLSGEYAGPPGSPRRSSAAGGVDGPVGDRPAAGFEDDEGVRSSGGLIIALAIIGVVAAATFLLWGRRKRDPEERDADQASTSETVEALPPMSASELEMSGSGWARQMIEMNPEGEIAAIAASSGRLIGVGAVTDGSGEGETSVWTSDGGVVWKSVSRMDVIGAAVVLTWKVGVLMTISYESGGQLRTACWRSSDGHDWEPLIGEGNSSSLAGVSFEGATEFGEVVVAWGRDSEGTGAWFSRDGANWQPSDLQGSFDLIDGTGDELLAFGRDPRERRALVARSTDGLSWEELDRQSRKVFEGASVASLTSFQGGVVAGGTDITRGIGALWVSDEGSTWHRIPFEPEVGTSITHVAVVNGDLLAVGTDTGRSGGGRGMPIVWESSDAISWSKVPVPRKMFADAVVDSVLPSAGSILMCGRLSDNRDGGRPSTVPVSWRWEPEQLVHADSSQTGHTTDHPVDEKVELVAAAGVERS